MKMQLVRSWVIVHAESGRRRYVTYKEARDYIEANPTYTYVWIGSVCMITVVSKPVKKGGSW